MSSASESTIRGVCSKYGNDRTRMMDIVSDVQSALRHVSGQAMQSIAEACGTHRVEVESVVSFYSFFTAVPRSRVVIRLCNDVIDKMQGVDLVAGAFEEALGIKMGETTADGIFALEWTPFIGMSDQAPAALINDEVVTYLSTDKAKRIIAELKADPDPKHLVRTLGDGNNANRLVRSMVHNNVRKRGAVIFGSCPRGSALAKALSMSPQEVIRDIKTSSLRGRGGAGFPTGMKWDFTRRSEGVQRYVLCNADEGEPGTFKDRVLLTERPDRLFEGMTIAGYAIGADTGVVYLRGEYAYLRAWLEDVLARRRADGLLGRDVCGKADFDFDIRIQMGAGAYVCGEETALISSCEGLRGDPKDRPPFPASQGYMACPTTVNNVETLCCVPAILEHGPAWFSQIGSAGGKGTKLLSISGDCAKPGVYEVEFGITLNEVLEMVGAPQAQAVQVGGPSGQMIGPDMYGRKICYDHLATGGSIMVFGQKRDLLDVVRQFMDFFVDESCGHCTPCRVGNVLLKERLERITAGEGTAGDIEYLRELSEVVKLASRCGFGQTSTNPILSSLANFRAEYDKRIPKSAGKGVFLPSFDVRKALTESENIAGRQSVVFPD